MVRKREEARWKIRVKGTGVREGKEGKDERVYVSRFVLSPLWTLTFHLIPCILLLSSVHPIS